MLTLIRIFSRLPLQVLYALAQGLLYPVAYYLIRYRRRTVRRNLLRCYPEKTNKERLLIEKQFYHWFCDLIAEIIYGYRISDEEIRRRVVFYGIEEMEQTLLDAGGGFVMLPHFGCWEWMADIAKRFESPQMHTHVIYRKLRNNHSDTAMKLLRQKRGCDLIDKNLLLRRMVTNRKEPGAHLYCMLSDQKPSLNNLDCWLPFFGEDTPFITGTQVLASKFSYPVFCTHIEMPSRGHYKVWLNRIDTNTDHSVSSYQPSVTEQFARQIEADIRQTPHIWLWTHNRFKWTKKDIKQA